MGGLGRFRGRPVVVIGTEKGDDTESRVAHNFAWPGRGLPQGSPPAGTRRALQPPRAHLRGHQRRLPRHRCGGARPGRGDRPLGRGCLQAPVPIVATIIGEGGSGGAIALAAADRVLMLEHAIYSVISPEGCASILVARRSPGRHGRRRAAADGGRPPGAPPGGHRCRRTAGRRAPRPAGIGGGARRSRVAGAGRAGGHGWPDADRAAPGEIPGDGPRDRRLTRNRPEARLFQLADEAVGLRGFGPFAEVLLVSARPVLHARRRPRHLAPRAEQPDRLLTLLRHAHPPLPRVLHLHKPQRRPPPPAATALAAATACRRPGRVRPVQVARHHWHLCPCHERPDPWTEPPHLPGAAAGALREQQEDEPVLRPAGRAAGQGPSTEVALAPHRQRVDRQGRKPGRWRACRRTPRRPRGSRRGGPTGAAARRAPSVSASRWLPWLATMTKGGSAGQVLAAPRWARRWNTDR